MTGRWEGLLVGPAVCELGRGERPRGLRAEFSGRVAGKRQGRTSDVSKALLMIVSRVGL